MHIVMRVVIALLVILSIALLASGLARAGTQCALVCPSAWGASSGCGGCNGMVCQTPAPTDKVKTDAASANGQWVALSTLQPTDNIYVINGTPSSPLVCSQAVAVLVSSLTVGPAPPPPVPSPTTTNTELLSWTPCALNTDGSVCHPVSYHIRWFGPSPGEVIVPASTLTYTIQKLSNGSYTTTIATIDATGEGDASNAASFVINAAVATWIVKACVPGDCPATELILSQDGSHTVGGYMLGRVTNGAACDPVKQIGTATTEWHLLAEKDVSLASPTYKGRQLIAVCVKQ